MKAAYAGPKHWLKSLEEAVGPLIGPYFGPIRSYRRLTQFSSLLSNLYSKEGLKSNTV